MAEATPGPWMIGLPGGPSGPFWSLVNGQGNVVAMQIVSEANARLLRSAPDLLDACLLALEDLETWHSEAFALPAYDVVGSCDGCSSCQETLPALRAAIAKATGAPQ